MAIVKRLWWLWAALAGLVVGIPIPPLMSGWQWLFNTYWQQTFFTQSPQHIQAVMILIAFLSGPIPGAILAVSLVAFGRWWQRGKVEARQREGCI